MNMVSSRQAMFLGFLFVMPIVIVVNLMLRRPVTRMLGSIVVTLYGCGVVAVTFFPIPFSAGAILHMKAYGQGVIINLVPFKGMLESLNSSLYEGLKNIGGNVLLLLPLGCLGAYKRFFRNTGNVILAGLILSLGIELLQWLLTEQNLIYPRSGDVDDVMLNTAGFTVGSLIYNKWAKGRPRRL
ncbi:VanZ family protein [Paenibacillus sp. SN-8-1]|uniref:VanZ family protein n=1 Tax=Paenibacillus sp. SN-8-1 TaxID=3435409 RepID=UPI003D9A596D